MNADALKELTLKAIEDLKGTDINVFDVRDQTTLADYMIICSGRSNRHVKSIAENIIKEGKQHKISYLRAEGEREGEWIIVDMGDVITHIMLPNTREFYNLEDLWEPIKELRDNQSNAS